jgi:hypothetical protein
MKCYHSELIQQDLVSNGGQGSGVILQGREAGKGLIEYALEALGRSCRRFQQVRGL